MLKFNISDNYVNQGFSIPSPFVRYIMINMDCNNLKKLYKTCKHFYARFQINILNNLVVDKKNNQTVYTLSFDSHQLDQLPNNLWLTSNLSIFGIHDLSPLISKIIRCDLCEAYFSTDMTINEYLFLTRSGNIEYMIIHGTIYSSQNNTETPLEDLLSPLINATYIRVKDCFVTKDTMKKLLQVNFNKKLTALSLRGINQMLDANLMDLFLQKNLENRAGVETFFKNEDDNRLFLSQIFVKIDAWIPAERKPLSFPYAFMIQE